MAFHHHELDNGLNLVGESRRSARSVALGFMVRTGARDETAEEAGLSHFLERMVFKGTERRSAMAVNLDFDRIGADYNAFTSDENTVFYSTILPEYLPQAIDILSDILRPSLRQDDFDGEKNVILEEIAMYEDRPATIAYDYAKEVFFKNHNLGNSILGTEASVSALTREQMMDYFNRRYGAANITVSIAGAFDWDEVVELVHGRCGKWNRGQNGRTGLDEARGTGELKALKREEVTEEHLILMSPGPSLSSPLRFAADTLGVALGDDSGSRLYWSLIQPGHVGYAGAGYSQHEGTGVLYTTFACEPERVETGLNITVEVLRDLEKNSITAQELEQAKNKILSALVRRSERSLRRRGDVCMNCAYLGAYRSIDDELRDYEAVSLDSIRQVLEQYPPSQVTTFALGPMSEDEIQNPNTIAN